MSKDTRIAELEAKATPKAMKQYKFKHIESEPVDLCPVCEKIIAMDEYVFCPYCGQALDRGNYEL